MRYERFAFAKPGGTQSRVIYTKLRRKAPSFIPRPKFFGLAASDGALAMPGREVQKRSAKSWHRQQFLVFCPNSEWSAGPFAVASSSLTGTVQVDQGSRIGKSQGQLRNFKDIGKDAPGHGPGRPVQATRRVNAAHRFFEFATVLADEPKLGRLVDGYRGIRCRRSGGESGRARRVVVHGSTWKVDGQCDRLVAT